MAAEKKKTGNKPAGKGKKAAEKNSRSAAGKKTGSRTAAAKKTAAKKAKRSSVRSELLLLVTLLAVLFLLLSLFGAIGMLGTKIANFEFGAFGSLAFAFPFLFLAAAVFVGKKGREYPVHTALKLLLGFLAFTLLCGFSELLGSQGALQESAAVYYHMGRQPRLSGGFFGGIWCLLLVERIGRAGSYIILFVLLSGSLALLLGRALLIPLGRKGGEMVEAIRDENHRYQDAAKERRRVAQLRIEEREQRRAQEKAERQKAEEEKKQAALARQTAGQAEKKENTDEKSGIRLDEVRLKKDSILKQEALLRAQAEAKEEADRKEAEKKEKSGWQQMTLAEAEALKDKPLDGLIREMKENRDGATREIRTLRELEALDRGEEPPVSATSAAAEKPLPPKRELFSDDVIMRGRDRMNPSNYVATGRIARGYSGRKKAEPAAAPTADPAEAADKLAEKAMRSLSAAKGTTEPRIRFSQPAESPEAEEHTGENTVETGRRTAYDREAASAPEKIGTEADGQEYTEDYEDPRDQLKRPEKPIGSGPETEENGTAFEEETSIWSSGKDRSGSGSTVFSSARKTSEKGKTTAAQAGKKEAASAAALPEGQIAPKEYRLPPISLLKKGKNTGGTGESELKETARILERTLADFGVVATVTDISCGPAVTRYELRPEQGVRVNRIAALADDIKLTLAATDIRIEAPIPGKSAVGIEVPNSVNQTVYFRTIIESEEFSRMNSKIGFAVGQDIGGQVIVSDLAKMPHLLIAGATGSGKSVCVNGIIMSILYRAKPDEVQLLLIDPKMVELTDYNGIPHLRIPVVTDPKQAADALNGAVKEMTARYKKFADMNVRDIKTYNAKIRENPEEYPGHEPLPQMVIIVDEFADLMMTAAGDVEQAICRLAQLARAAGIHLVLATQRPSVNVITGLIKANIQSRIALAVTSGTDSRIILDMTGAEKLLGHGDMLFYPTGYPKPVRVQGCFVSDEEIAAVTEFWKKQNSGFTEEEARRQNRSWMEDPIEREHPVEDERDELFLKAAEYIIDNDKASIGNLQRVFRIGFNRAARLMDQLAEAGIVGKDDGTKARQIMMDRDQLDGWERENGYL